MGHVFFRSLPQIFSSGVIGHATSEDGLSWTVDDDPILENGDVGEWNSGFIFESTTYATNDGYVMYYTGFARNSRDGNVGRATSEDGIVWEKR